MMKSLSLFQLGLVPRVTVASALVVLIWLATWAEIG
jgi:hypothetical protein